MCLGIFVFGYRFVCAVYISYNRCARNADVFAHLIRPQVVWLPANFIIINSRVCQIDPSPLLARSQASFLNQKPTVSNTHGPHPGMRSHTWCRRRTNNPHSASVRSRPNLHGCQHSYAVKTTISRRYACEEKFCCSLKRREQFFFSCTVDSLVAVRHKGMLQCVDCMIFQCLSHSLHCPTQNIVRVFVCSGKKRSSCSGYCALCGLCHTPANLSHTNSETSTTRSRSQALKHHSRNILLCWLWAEPTFVEANCSQPKRFQESRWPTVLKTVITAHERVI